MRVKLHTPYAVVELEDEPGVSGLVGLLGVARTELDMLRKKALADLAEAQSSQRQSQGGLLRPVVVQQGGKPS